MAVLSDDTILSRFSSLIDQGDASRARGCSYSFVTGKIFPSYRDENSTPANVVDWTGQPANAWPGEEVYEVRPGALISLRTREIVRMPSDLCGIWNQTDMLSRNGLLLVNLSSVPPGYEGHLTCTFVNFGKKNVRIQPDTRIAKLMFLSLDGVAKHVSKPWDTRSYDGNLAAAASESPATFLQVSEHTRALEAQIARGVADVAEAGAAESKKASKQMDAHLQAAQTKFHDAVTKDSRNAVLMATPIAFVAIGFLAFAQWWATNVLTTHVETVAKERADQIEARINKQLESVGTKPVFVYSGSEESKALLERIKSLEADVKALEAARK